MRWRLSCLRSWLRLRLRRSAEAEAAEEAVSRERASCLPSRSTGRRGPLPERLLQVEAAAAMRVSTLGRSKMSVFLEVGVFLGMRAWVHGATAWGAWDLSLGCMGLQSGISDMEWR